MNESLPGVPDPFDPSDATDPRPPYVAWLERGCFAHAEELLDALILQRPELALLWHARGTARWGLGRTDDALSDLEAAAARGLAHHVENLRLCVQAHHARGDWPRATDVAARWIHCARGRPDEADALAYMALMRHEAGDLPLALRLASQARRLRTDHGLALTVEALGLIVAADLDTAVTLLQSVLTAHPGDAHAWRALALLRLRKGRAASAIAPLRKAMRWAPGYLRFALTLGWACIAAGRLPEAHQAFERAMNAAGSRREAQGGLASVYALLGKNGAAIHMVREVERAGTDTFGAAFARIVVKVRRGDLYGTAKQVECLFNRSLGSPDVVPCYGVLRELCRAVWSADCEWDTAPAGARHR